MRFHGKDCSWRSCIFKKCVNITWLSDVNFSQLWLCRRCGYGIADQIVSTQFKDWYAELLLWNLKLYCHIQSSTAYIELLVVLFAKHDVWTVLGDSFSSVFAHVLLWTFAIKWYGYSHEAHICVHEIVPEKALFPNWGLGRPRVCERFYRTKIGVRSKRENKKVTIWVRADDFGAHLEDAHVQIPLCTFSLVHLGISHVCSEGWHKWICRCRKGSRTASLQLWFQISPSLQAVLMAQWVPTDCISG